MKLCIRSHDLGQKSLSALTEKLTDYDIDGVQLVCYKTFDSIKYQPEQLNPHNTAEIATALNNAGKKAYLIGAYFNPVHSNAQKVDMCKNIFKEYLEFSNALGCNVVGSETGSFNDDKWTYHPKNRTESALQTVINTFKQLCEYAVGFNAKVAIEGAAGHVCYDVATLKRAFDSINMPNLKVIIDIYNFLDEGNYNNYLEIMENALKTFKGKIHCFHLKDFDVKQDGTVVQVPIGKGRIDYPRLIKMIRDYDADAILVLEGTTGEHIEPTVKLVRQLWQG